MMAELSSIDEDVHLSFVATTRNDNHGGDMLRRMNIFVDNLVGQCKRHRLKAELILVEWNPPTDRPKLIDALTWPADNPSCPVRIVEVPPQLHAKFRHAASLPLFQMIAKNVGIRRARGRFIVATNVDILFSDKLIRTLKRRLRSGKLYRLDRYDIKIDVPEDASVAERLAFCNKRENLLRICRRGGTDNRSTRHYDVIFPRHSELWARAKIARLAPAIIKKRYDMTPDHAASFYQFHRSIGRMHTNACGDFTLLSRDDWHRLQGYAEWEMYSFHIDSLLCHQAWTAGIDEVFLGGKNRIYHIEHGEGSGYTPEAQDKLWQRLETEEIGRLSDTELWQTVQDLRAGRKHPVFTEPNWGLAQHDLPEYHP